MNNLQEAIGKVFLKDRYSAIYRLGDDGNVWHCKQSGKASHCGSVEDFRGAVAKGQWKFHPFTEDVETALVGKSKIIYNWK